MKFSMRDPDRWFWHVQEELELLRAYVSNVENQLEMGLKKFVKSYMEEDIEEVGENGNPVFVHQVQVYDGLDDSTWSIEEIFNNHFPSLHRRSCFITIYSLIEYSLDDLCNRFAQKTALEVTQQDLKGKGIDRSRLYLRKVIGLDWSNVEEPWNKVKNIQAVRNWIVHNNGRVTETEQKIIKRISHVHLKEHELVLEKDFLLYALACFENLCKTIHESMKVQDDKPRAKNL